MKFRAITCFIITIALIFVLIGCDSGLTPPLGSSSSNSGSTTPSGQSDPNAPKGDRDPVAVVLPTTADGISAYTGNAAIIDTSNTANGYFMVKYTGSKEKIKMQVTHNGGEPYTYDLIPGGDYEVFPLAPGNGSYTVTINENIEGTSYAVVDTHSFEVTLEDEFQPFLHPSKYVNYTDSPNTVALSEDLADGAFNDLDVVESVYNYVTNNVSYDHDRAATTTTFYIPDMDVTLSSNAGLCFDYAGLMTSMLRAQRIPTQLVIGYAGDVYHAWISVYTPETGWVKDIIQFDGVNWVRMDPTFASSAGDPSIEQYIGDGKNYNAMFFY